jgi:hypothetical protein
MAVLVMLQTQAMPTGRRGRSTGLLPTGLLLAALLIGCGSVPTGASGGNGARVATPTPASVPAADGPTSTPGRWLTPPPRPARSPLARPGPKPAFGWTVRAVSAAALGASWRRGCPVPPSDLRAVSVRFWGFDSAPHTGILVLHRDVVARTRLVFATMFERRFPIRGIRPVSEFGASDDASMAADNTSAFNCRRAVAAGPPTWSRHAYGRAIDVNPVENPYLFGKRVLPPSGRAFIDRSAARRGLIRRGDPIHRAFRRAGYRWGGEFSNPDYQHFDR